MHFVMGVFSNSPDDVEKLLDPFCEGTEDPEFIEFVLADHSMEDMRAEYEDHKGEYPEFSDFVLAYYGYVYNEETNEFGRFCNPNAKWDWYVDGGRWSNMIRLKPELEMTNCKNCGAPLKVCDQAQLKDILLDRNHEEYDKAMRRWDLIVNHATPSPDEDVVALAQKYGTKQYLELFYKSGDEYAKSFSEMQLCGYVSPSGDWVEESGINPYDLIREMAAENPELWLTIVDCHI